MIIVLKNADFSASNIGTLSTWRITRSLGAGATYEGPTSVDKGAAFSAIIVIDGSYEVGSAGITVTMGGVILSDVVRPGGGSNDYTIYIAEVTGNIVIKVPTVNINTGEEEEPEIPDTPVVPDEPEGETNLITLGNIKENMKCQTTSSAIIADDTNVYSVSQNIPVVGGNVYEFTNIARSWWKTASGDIENFLPGTNKSVVLMAPTNAELLDVTFKKVDAAASVVLAYDKTTTNPIGENVISGGTLVDGKSLSSGNYSLTANEGYFTYENVPVEPNAVYVIKGGARAWWRKSDKSSLSTFNLAQQNRIAVAPSDAAYLSVSISKTTVPNTADATMIKVY